MYTNLWAELIRSLIAEIDAEGDLIRDGDILYKELIGKRLNFVRTTISSPIIDLGVFKTKVDYIKKELEWYENQSLSINHMANPPKIWQQVCDIHRTVNSNYGFLIYSRQNGMQFDNVIAELNRNKSSRRAVMYYTNPWMHYQGGKDHICTLAVQYLWRGNKIHAVVFMRSNDVVYGLIGADLYWQDYVLKKVCYELGAAPGNITWIAGSLHIYERHFDKVKELLK